MKFIYKRSTVLRELKNLRALKPANQKTVKRFVKVLRSVL